MPSTVFVGLSGGVDSAVSAHRLLAAGHCVVGVFIKVWHPLWLQCNWQQERIDAMRVAAFLGIPFLTCDAEAAYRDAVAADFITAYTAGRTPNPDVLCNQYVKFGAFLEFARTHGADFIATGHYARRVNSASHPDLHRGVDPAKDQSYFLWSLTEEQLSASLLPVGDTYKNDVRNEAQKIGLPVAAKRDSQGICFLGHVDIKAFLSHYTELIPGPIVDVHGTYIGTHEGALLYTLGQRHGFHITDHNPERPPYFVQSKDMQTNTLIVDTVPPTSEVGTTIVINNTTWRTKPVVGGVYEAQFRYRQPPVPITITDYSEATVTLTLTSTSPTPARGQSCVLYSDTLCLGGGMIA